MGNIYYAKDGSIVGVTLTPDQEARFRAPPDLGGVIPFDPAANADVVAGIFGQVPGVTWQDHAVVGGRLLRKGEEVAWDLAAEKARRYAEFDAKTQALIARGVQFGRHVFSMSANAQINWTNLMMARAMFVYPLPISTVDDGAYELADANAVLAFYTTGIARVKAVLDAGRNLKLAVEAAATKAEVDAVADTRS